MQTVEFHTPFGSISQRVVCSYLRSLSEYTFILPEGLEPAREAEMEASQRDLHAFFTALYEALYRTPATFGMSEAADMYVNREGNGGSKDQQEVNQKLKTARKPIVEWLTFLMAAGKEGAVEGQRLVFPPEIGESYLKKTRTAKKFLPGLASFGLSLSVTPQTAALECSGFPAMMPALQALASACTQFADARVSLFHFGRCDFKALRQGYEVAPEDLYRIFNPPDAVRAASLHRYFMGRHYKAIVNIAGVETWLVQYQGNRKIKSTPLFQIQFDERKVVQRQVQFKCVSANRIAGLIQRQSKALQDDFFRRKNNCNGDRCNWCEGKKGLGPSVLAHEGQEYTICWYINPDMTDFNDGTIELIKEYEQMHDALLLAA